MIAWHGTQLNLYPDGSNAFERSKTALFFHESILLHKFHTVFYICFLIYTFIIFLTLNMGFSILF